MLILAGFDQKLLCQGVYLFSFSEENSITNGRMQPLPLNFLLFFFINAYQNSSLSITTIPAVTTELVNNREPAEALLLVSVLLPLCDLS